MRIVLDTNVFVSGVFFSCPPYKILKAWRDGRLQLLVSEEILEEYHRVGELLSDEFPHIDLGPFLELLTINTELIVPEKISNQVCDDPDDDKFISCALGGKCKMIISGDKHLLRVSGYEGVHILRPRKFVDEYLD